MVASINILLTYLLLLLLTLYRDGSVPDCPIQKTEQSYQRSDDSSLSERRQPTKLSWICLVLGFVYLTGDNTAVK